ncbi:MAG: hypothetical protein DHS20C19_17880 [Acidimicrobiales bacterium]|nr:MAG: hypothetical protein DHS20C19_17880 [Acidimicrobiales bacterium]
MSSGRKLRWRDRLLAPPADLDPTEGYWPGWKRKFANDFMPAKDAQANDGLVPPEFEDASWILDGEGSGSRVVLEAARSRHVDAEARGRTAEQRAHRLVQSGLTLLAVSFALTGFELNRLRDAQSPIWAWVVVALISVMTIALLTLAVVQAISVDRVGYYQPVNPASAAEFGSEDSQRRAIVAAEMRGAALANWTGLKKVNEFLQARAWFSRAVAMLVVSGLTAALLWVLAVPDESPVAATRVLLVNTDHASDAMPGGTGESPPSTTAPTPTTTRKAQPAGSSPPANEATAADWLAAIGTVGALMTAILVLARDTLDRRRNQARKVNAWAVEILPKRDRSDNGALVAMEGSCVLVRALNTGEEPAYDFHVWVHHDFSPQSAIMGSHDRTILHPGSQDVYVDGVQLPEGGLASLPLVDVTFRDAAGRRWQRLHTGQLSRDRISREGRARTARYRVIGLWRRSVLRVRRLRARSTEAASGNEADEGELRSESSAEAAQPEGDE